MANEMRLSQLAQEYPASGIRKMFNLAAQYPNAIKLTVGEPNFDTPEYIKDAAKKGLDDNLTHYTPNAGIPELREAVAEKGMVISGTSPDGRLVESIELPEKRFFVAGQFHPEFKSRSNRPHPLFKGFVGAAVAYMEEKNG